MDTYFDPSKRDDLKSLLTRTIIRQEIDRHVRGQLDLYEYSLLTLLFDQTIAWGLKWTILSVTEITNGRKNTFAGTGMSRRKAFDTIKALEEKGIITRQGGNRQRNRYKINLLGIGIGEDMLPIRKSKKRAPTTIQVEPKCDEFSDDVTDEIHIDTPENASAQDAQTRAQDAPFIKESIIKEEEIAPLPHSGPEKSIKALDKVTDTALKTSTEKRSLKNRKLTSHVLAENWTGLVKHYWPEAITIGWTPKIRGMATHALKNEFFNQVAPMEFFEWVVSEWGLLKHSIFSWMDNKPEYPDPQFCITHIYRMMQVYADRAALRQAMDILGPKALASAYRRKGMTVEMAVELAERRKREGKGVKHPEQIAIDQSRKELERERSNFLKLKARDRANLSAGKRGRKSVHDKIEPLTLPDIDFNKDE